MNNFLGDTLFVWHISGGVFLSEVLTLENTVRGFFSINATAFITLAIKRVSNASAFELTPQWSSSRRRQKAV